MIDAVKAARVSFTLAAMSLALDAQTFQLTAVSETGLVRLELRGAFPRQTTFTFFDGAIPIGTVNASGAGSVSFAAPLLRPGEHTICAVAWGSGEPVASTGVTIAGRPLGGLSDARAFPTGITPLHMAAGDLSGHGQTDVVVAGDGQAAILRNRRHGDFAPPVVIPGPANPVGLALADFDGDGYTDIAVIGHDGHLMLWRNGAVSEVSLGIEASGLTTADFNGDGIPDLAISYPEGNLVTIFRGKGDGTFTLSGRFAVGISPRAIVAGDFNGDGIADLATANYTSDDVTVLLGDGKGGFRLQGSYPAGSGPSSLALAGADDLVVWDAVGASATVITNNGIARSILGVSAVGGGSQMATALHDGQLELAGYRTQGGPVPVALLAVDLNGDGIPDVAEADATGGVYVALGRPSISSAVVADADSTPAFSAEQTSVAMPKPRASTYYFTVMNMLVGPEARSSSVFLLGTGSWAATTNASWLHLANGSTSGSTGQLLFFTIDANPGARRYGAIIVNNDTGYELFIEQAASGSVAIGPFTLASSGLNQPYAVTVDGNSNAYFTDTFNNAIKEWNASTGQVSTLVSSGLSQPESIALHSNLYIADTRNNAIKKWGLSSQTMSTVAGSGLNWPGGVAVDGPGNVYIADSYNSAIKKWDAVTGQVSTLVSSNLSYPQGVALDAAGNLYIADTNNNAIKEWNAVTGQVSTLVSSGLNQPWNVAVDGFGNVYIADSYNSAIKKWDASTQQVSTLVSSGLRYPSGLAVDFWGNVFIADTLNSALKMLPNAWLSPTVLLPPTAGNYSLGGVIAPTLQGAFAVTSDQPWLTPSFEPIGRDIRARCTANPTNTSRTATVSLMGVSVTVSQGPGVNLADVSVSPRSGTSLSQMFTATYSDGGGYADISEASFMVGSTTSGAASCDVKWVQSQNWLYLGNDAGTGWLGPATAGSGGTLQNSQCTLNVGSSSAVGSGTVLTLNLSLTFQPSYTGAKTIWETVASSSIGSNTGWQAMGSWTVPPPFPTVVSLSPSSGSGVSQTFSFVFSDPAGYRDMLWEQVLISGSGGSAACHAFYSGATNQLFLATDNGMGSLGPAVLGASGTLQNSQCILNAGGSSAVASGNTLTLNLAVTFQPSFTGAKNIWAAAASWDGLNSDWQWMGSWSPSSPVPAVVSLSPPSGTGSSQTFSVVFSDAGGYQDMLWHQVLIAANGALAACHIFASGATNQLFLATDDKAHSLGPAALGASGTLQNSQCTLNAGASSAVGSGTTLTLKLAVTFQPSFSGTKNIWVAAASWDGLNSDWQWMGSWTPD